MKKYFIPILLSFCFNTNFSQTDSYKNTLVEFIQETNSSHAKSILEDFKNSVKKFILVKPKSVKLDKVLDNKSAAA